MQVAIRPTGAPDAPPLFREIVGVVQQVKGRPDETEDLLQIYVPLAQHTVGDIFLLVRPQSGAGHALAPAVRDAFAQVDREQLTSVRPMITLEEVAAGATGRYRFRAVLVLTFAGLALVLALFGVFGVIAYSVEQRIRDIGVRRALGATTTDILRVVGRGAAVMVGVGALAGIVLSIAAGRLLTSLLFGVQPLDVRTFALVVGVVAATAVLSVAAPALRATRIDPAIALRTE
jgi:putative ABC transport system permease protein